MLGNLFLNEKPDFAQFNISYCLTGKDVISLKLKTWKYYKPLGIDTIIQQYQILFGRTRTSFSDIIFKAK